MAICCNDVSFQNIQIHILVNYLKQYTILLLCKEGDGFPTPLSVMYGDNNCWPIMDTNKKNNNVDKHHVNETVYRDVVVGEIKMQNIVSIFLQN